MVEWAGVVAWVVAVAAQIQAASAEGLVVAATAEVETVAMAAGAVTVMAAASGAAVVASAEQRIPGAWQRCFQRLSSPCLCTPTHSLNLTFE